MVDVNDIQANIRLRPLRIGFLVEPNDIASIREVMKYCTTVWGGIFNPIIPVFKRPPRAWANDRADRIRGVNVAKGYVRFFEPDVYVESAKGLLELAGLGAFRERFAIYPDVAGLDELLKPEQHKDWCEPLFGLTASDIYRHAYLIEQQFTRRDKRENILVSDDVNSGLAELIFGVFPRKRSVRHIAREYQDVFQPTKLSATPDAWRKVFEENALTPFRVAGFGLDCQRYWHHDTIIFVFDPSRPADLIDAWNLRLEPHPIIPVPVDWFELLSDSIFSILKAAHRPIQGNPQKLMHNATIEFSRSIPTAHVETLVRSLKPGLPSGSVTIKTCRNRIWVDHRDRDYVHRGHRMKVTAAEKSIKLILSKDDRGSRSSFETISPEFAERYGGRGHRWINAVTLSSFSEPVATVLPFNTVDPNWPHLGLGGERVLVGSEGWIFSQKYKDTGQSIEFPSHETAISGALERVGIKSKLSEPGHIARQMLDHLGGLWGVHLLANIETLSLLNKMAGGVRTRSTGAQTVEESFELRAAPWKDWTDLIARRKQTRRLPEATLGDFTSRNVIRIGLETECPHCQAKNWTGLKTVDYDVACERCLKNYAFPQAHLRDHNRNWSYRVVGPFSVPDYGRGSYCALLALRLISRFGSSLDKMTFATAMEVSIDSRKAELDFLALRASNDLDAISPPELVIGEAKSLGQGPLIKPRDLAQLKLVASKLPGAIVLVAVLRDHFLPEEKRILEKFVKWGRRLNSDGEPTNPVVLLTSKDLLFDHHLSATWTELGGAHAKFGTYDHTRNMRSIADATQQIYLGLPSFLAVRRAQWEKRMKRRKDKVQEFLLGTQVG